MSRAENEIKELERIMDRTKAYWKGDAGRVHREIFDELTEELYKMAAVLPEVEEQQHSDIVFDSQIID